MDEGMRRRLRAVRCFLLDMDGTFYLGENLLPGSMPFIGKLRETGRDFLFLTNNSSHDGEYYVARLGRMGLSVEKRQVFTSGQATALYLKAHFPGKTVFLLGNEYLRREMEGLGVRIEPEHPDMVVAGFDTTLDYAKMCRVCDLVRAGLPFVATHPDFNCPTESGFIPDIGAILAFIEASTGRRPDAVVGKPNAPIVESILRHTGLRKEELAMVGDRLYTDIRTGLDHGILSILVLTGETAEEDVKHTPYRPDLVFPSLREIGEAL